ncbi:TPA: hypothetical protein NU463_004723 [Escherichia coli]|uniref:Uncharacterized protein n=2 Tax=Seoulvirus SPN3US TaxID=1984796 RepID=G5DEG5_9CAUD|nr:hypothetical protein [Escherichia coli]YP_009153366.1 hypothetical protein ACQ60_gp194 [Salmonella phage SPN3US]EJV9699270.1 hypothetical protein [Salmonella enterica]QNN97495.1 hypothetical protein [Proteus phage 7]AEP83905.1 hypothetical protein SPN3US_0072 [Salmonella phage SPN3US]VVZ87242.1 Uncharacterised protein [Escherichia coli]HCJ5819064.1 hypothetical protein [Escherichia coli]
MEQLRSQILNYYVKQTQFNQRVQQLTAPKQNTVRRIKGLGGEILLNKS